MVYTVHSHPTPSFSYFPSSSFFSHVFKSVFKRFAYVFFFFFSSITFCIVSLICKTVHIVLSFFLSYITDLTHFLSIYHDVNHKYNGLHIYSRPILQSFPYFSPSLIFCLSISVFYKCLASFFCIPFHNQPQI